jgi:hypothetical protein
MSSFRRARSGSFIHCNQGKGAVGCLFSLFLLVVAALAAYKVCPPYFAYKSLETDIKTEISRAGAHLYDDETLTRDVMDLARRNEIRLKQEEIKVERYAGQVHIKIEYSVPIDLIVYEHAMEFKIEASSFIGRL